MPKISVVIPCYNQALYLLDSIGSVLRQTYKDIEIIVVDDGSTDNTKKVCVNSIFPNVTYSWQENQGLSAARNAGIKLAKGKYILPLDADDKLHPNCVEKMVAKLDEVGSGIIYVDYFEFGESNQYIPLPEYSFETLKKGNYMVCSSMFRKEDWQKVGGYDESLKQGYEDWQLWLKMGLLGIKGYHIRQPLFNYRIRKNSMVTKTTQIHAQVVEQIKKTLPQLDN